MFLLIRNNGSVSVDFYTDGEQARKEQLRDDRSCLIETNQMVLNSPNIKRDENIFELAVIFHNMLEHGDINTEAYEKKNPTVSLYEEGRSLVFNLADEFETIHKDTDWNEKSYYDEISEFGKSRIREYFKEV